MSGTNRIVGPVLAAGALALAMCASASAGVRNDDGMWELVDVPGDAQLRAEPWVRPNFYQGVYLDQDVLRVALEMAPVEFTRGAFENPVIIDMPMPDGTFQRFEVVESPIMHPDLAAQFPEIKTYSGQGIDDPTATLRFDITPSGFHAQILSAEGSFYIDPFSKGDTAFYASYEKSDLRDRVLDQWTCFSADRPDGQQQIQMRNVEYAARSGTFLQTYRTAVAATGEYTAFHGGTVVAGQAAIVTAINRVTGIYEREMAIRLQLVANNSTVVYTNSATDPYTNNNGGTMLGQNQANLDSVIGSANYDLGHVFSTGGGGIAGLGVVCVGGNKARGVTGLPSPTGDAFYVDYVAHEMGHQFGAAHSFNSNNANCVGQRSSTSAYEPGSGSTIMSYAGLCGADNLQNFSNDYFIHRSFDQILSFSTGGTGGCPTNVANGNTVPSVDAGPNYTIPISTPFMLTPGAVSDPNGDTLTYCWEQRNLGAAQSASGGAFPDNGSSPSVRSFVPTTNPVRIIPRVPNLLNNTFILGEALPSTNRTQTFRLTVRDNRTGGGGVNTDDMTVTSTTSAGPFLVTAPNGGGTFSGSTTVTWNVANTTNSPVLCANVKIELSQDGGNTWPHLLTASTPNDGSELVTLPSITSSVCRVRVMAVGNIFFDISNANFSVTPAPLPQAFSLTTPANGLGNVVLTPTLIWTISTNATSYNVILDDEPSLTPPHIFTTTTGLLSVAIPPATLIEGETYFWRVTASNINGSTVGSPNPANFTTVPPPPFCQGDANGDDVVDFADISAILTAWLTVYTPGSEGFGDANNDGDVNFIDISTVLSNYLVPCL